MKIELTLSEKRKARFGLLAFPFFIPMLIVYFCILAKGLQLYFLVILLPFIYSVLRDLYFLYKDHWLNVVFKVDDRYIEKVLPNGSKQRAAWCDIQDVNPYHLSTPCRFGSWLSNFLFGKKSLDLIFSDGTVISISRLLHRKLLSHFFFKIYSEIAINGPLGNPLLMELREVILSEYDNTIKHKENAFIRWCIISQIFPLGWLIFAQLAYFWMDMPWNNYIVCICIAVLISIFTLAIVCTYFLIPRFKAKQKALSTEISDAESEQNHAGEV